MTVNVPQEFLNLARGMGINKQLATDVYVRKINQKPNIDDLVSRMALSHGTESQAKQAINKLWVTFNKLNHDHESIPIEVSAKVIPQIRVTDSTYIEDARQALNRFVGHINTHVPYDGKKTAKDRIAVGGDIHGVFADEEAFLKFCADPAETAIITGDFIDCLATSRHRITVDVATTRAELADAAAKVEHLAKSFKTVYYVRGNHDKRPLKRIQEIAPQLLPLIVDPLDLITSNFPNFKRVTSIIPGTTPNLPYGSAYEADFFGMVGDILVGHFETFMGTEALAGVQKWLSDWDHVLKLGVQPKVILQAHTHTLGMSFNPRGQLLINTGCLCRPMPYQFENAGKYRPPVKGYIALYQKNGITDLNKTECICLQ